MKLRLFPLLAAVVCVCSAGNAQQFKPKSIQFKGDPEYSDQELMAAAGLKTGVVLTSAEMSDHTKRLMDSGVFDGMSFKFDGRDLIFDVKPAADLYAVRLENLPLTPGSALDAKLHERFPLYHGKVPGEGGLTDDVRGALEEQLAAEGIKATVTATPYSDQKLHKVTAISYAITAPPVLIGEINPEGGALDAKASAALAKLPGSPYDREGSADAITRNLSTAYRDEGYLEANIHPIQLAASATADAVRIPFSVSIAPGPLYKVAAIHIAPDLVVSQADFDKQAHVHAGDVADSVRIRENWQYIERQYHNRGYIKAHVQVTPTLDHAQNTVSYEVTAEPGVVYKMGALSIENVSDDLRTEMLAAWKMPAGAVFNEGYILGFFATHAVNPKLERVFATVNYKFVLRPNDDAKTVDVELRLEKK